ncbi:iron-containing redox enzyme family protein [Brevibacterium sp. p3-SID960]|uniref:iron-containing redox enzyme family protein n=1 Tax=Brevibacterium sp. p3-SID960 TaxID=2916063 RepID=UPI0021A4540D|nr:iron-containing redox enzyme family protein [Brevibacterium sp. p3-SID960]MCT1690823.1 iron-containing redox enzyme family protein [Brevibacterium sp. p3-SID960]
MLSRRRYTSAASTARSTRCARPTPPAGRSPPAGTGKAALLGIQSDEYGGGRPDLVHAEVFAGTVRAMGLDDRPQAHPDRVPAATLLLFDVMNLFGLHRRLCGTIVGHLAAFEMTSSIPGRHYSQAFARTGNSSHVTWYFDEHVSRAQWEGRCGSYGDPALRRFLRRHRGR